MPYTARFHQITQSLIYHIINRGNARSAIYHDPEDYGRFLAILINYSQKRRIKIYHWVLMPNHYHLLLELEQPKELSSVMAGIGKSYVHYYHRKYNSAGHLFQDRFKSQAIEKELYLHACARYIERNPVKAKLVQSAEEYTFSSASCYVFGKEDGLTVTDPLIQIFGLAKEHQRENYRQFLREFEAEEEQVFSNFETPQGSEEFKRRIVKEKGLFIQRNGRPSVKVCT